MCSLAYMISGITINPFPSLIYMTAFSGIGVTVIFIPLQIYLANQFAAIRYRTAAATDQRVRYISEIIDGIGTVKSYAWENPFFSLIGKLRNQETQTIAESQTLRAINLGLYYSSTAAACFATFAVYWGTGGVLTTPQVFATISLLQTVRMSMGFFWTRGVERGSEVLASCQRIEAFLNLVDGNDEDGNETTSTVGPKPTGSILGGANYESVPETGVDIEHVELADTSRRIVVNSENDETLCRLTKSSFYYGEDETHVTLRDIELSVSREELVMVVGPVGAG